MKITFLGADHEVTGSCTLIEACGRKILIDCGMEQGADTFENRELPVAPSQIDCVLLTHAHIDHSGNLPLLVKNGFSGTIYATEATCQLCTIMLQDCAHIQMFEAEWKNRKAKRSGAPEVLPVYDSDDAQKAITLFSPAKYGRQFHIYEGVSVRYIDAGHLLGSASIELWLTEDGVTKKIVFSGDVGNINQPLIKDPERISSADYVVVESTYGDRLHEEKPDYVGLLADHIQKTLDRGGNVVIPSFAVGRTQEVLYFIRQIKNEGLVKGHDGFPVYVDSPLAIEATRIFMNCDRSCFDAETNKIIDSGVNPISFTGLKTAVTSEDSKAINADPVPKVIISASGMCEAGRIRHHLKHNLWRAESLVLFVGYQAVGTLGRALYDGAKSVKLFGEEIEVNAEIGFLPGISGHADQKGLLNWLSAYEPKPAQIFVNHGADGVCDSFAALIMETFGCKAYAPYSGTAYDPAKGKFIEEPKGVPTQSRAAKAKVTTVFDRLIASAQRLLTAVKGSSGLANKELARAADRIDTITDSLSKK